MRQNRTNAQKLCERIGKLKKKKKALTASKVLEVVVVGCIRERTAESLRSPKNRIFLIRIIIIELCSLEHGENK